MDEPERPSLPPTDHLPTDSGSTNTEKTSSPRTLVATDRLTKYFRREGGFFGRGAGAVRAVDGVNIRVRRGETTGLVGESGCGKSTLGRLLLKLVEPSFGRILFDGQDIAPMSQAALRPLRRRMQIIFQDPYSSLNPRLSIRETLAEPLQIHKLAKGRAEEDATIEELLKKVGMRPDVMNRYPHEFSGGQRQRIGIARALAVKPDFIVCDEPVSALDVSIQAQVVNLLGDLQDELGVAYLFISHDLRIVEHMSHRVCVMYLGRIVEQAPTAMLFESPMHPYTRALIGSAPSPDPTRKRLRIVLSGDAPSPHNPPSGCSFHPRCPRVIAGKCDKEAPELDELDLGSGHKVACFNPVVGSRLSVPS